MRLLRGLLRSKHPVYGSAKQLVFCGHSVGGALAHVALVKYMLGVLNNESDRIDDFGEAIAIGFGAPHICNRSARDYLRSCSSGEIERRIFNYVTMEDPVPRLLNSLPQAASRAVGSLAQKIKEAMLVRLVREYTGLESLEDVERSVKWLLVDNRFELGGPDLFGLSSQPLLAQAAESITTLVAAGWEVKDGGESVVGDPFTSRLT